MSIESELARFQKTERFEQLVAEARKKAIASGKSFGRGTGTISLDRMDAIAADIRQIFWKHIQEVIPSIDEEDLEIGVPVETKDGNYEIPISFNPDAIERASLWPEKWGEVDNIVALLTHGWDTDGKTVRGVWHGRMTESWPKRDGDPFMQDAANESEAAHPGVKVTLHQKYIDPYYYPTD